jgi:plasmid replication initiation protein
VSYRAAGPKTLATKSLRKRAAPTRSRKSEREQLDLFQALPGGMAPRDVQDLMAYPFFSLAKSKRLAPVDFKAGTITIRVEAVPEYGMRPSARAARSASN